MVLNCLNALLVWINCCHFLDMKTLILKVGMTHSYGNGRRLDDSKALGELDFQVKLGFMN